MRVLAHSPPRANATTSSASRKLLGKSTPPLSLRQPRLPPPHQPHPPHPQ
jgi:hypothetical protein